MKVVLKKVPASGGDVTTEEVEVQPTVTIGDVLRQAGVAFTKKMKLMIGDQAADEQTTVLEGATITLSEKPAGS